MRNEKWFDSSWFRNNDYRIFGFVRRDPYKFACREHRRIQSNHSIDTVDNEAHITIWALSSFG